LFTVVDGVVALALKCQLVEEGRIPMTETDWEMDVIIVDGEVLERKDR
jgi:5-formyltetrahydrofolate cyclo-ligase